MNLAAVWLELEASITPDQHHGRRRLHADAPVDLNITVTQPGPLRGLALTVRDEALRGVDELPSTRGFEHLRRAAAQPGQTIMEIRLTDPAANDMFVGLAEDVARATAAADDDFDAVGLWISRIRSWQRLMARGPRGLSDERQLGLYAELDVLRADIVATGRHRESRRWLARPTRRSRFSASRGSLRGQGERNARTTDRHDQQRAPAGRDRDRWSTSHPPEPRCSPTCRRITPRDRGGSA